MRGILLVVVGTAAVLTGSPAAAGEAPGQLGQIVRRARQFRDVEMTDAEERQLGEAVSEQIRLRYGVVQSAAVHKYVTLVGTVLAQASARPGLAWRFIVLDTDGVNAFAAPGGYLHVTRGALGLLQDESELAGVLAHEIVHVTEKHTVKAIQKGKLVQMGADETFAADSALFNRMVEKSTELVMAGFGRAEELESDEKGLVLASRVGYAPRGLATFLTRLTERNEASAEKQGLFASHPEMQERLQRSSRTIDGKKLASTSTLRDRYARHISYQTPPLTAVAQVEAGAAGLTGGGASGSKGAAGQKPAEGAKPQEKPRGFGLSRLVKPGGTENKSAEVTGSGASRGVDTERSARGGSNPAEVPVTLTPAEVAAFKSEGKLA